MKREWVVFSHDGRELLRYTLRGEGEDEREQTIELLAFENDILPSEISVVTVCG